DAVNQMVFYLVQIFFGYSEKLDDFPTANSGIFISGKERDTLLGRVGALVILSRKEFRSELKLSRRIIFVQDIGNRIHEGFVYNEFASVLINSVNIIDVVHLSVLDCRNQIFGFAVYFRSFTTETSSFCYANSFFIRQ